MMKPATTIRLVTTIVAGMLAVSAPVFADKHMQDEERHDQMMRERGADYGMGRGGMGMMGNGMMGNGMMGGGMMGGGMMGGGMMGGGMSSMMMNMLDLDDKQRDKLRDLQRAQQKSNWSRRGEMIDLQYELQDLYDKDKPDAKAIGKVYDKIFSLKKQMIESHIETHNKMRDVLNKEQQERFDDMRGGMGYGGMGMMGGGMGMME